MKMIKSLLLLLMCVNVSLIADSKLVRHLQEKYYDEVILDTVYKERFHKFLAKTCKNNNDKCQNKLIAKLKDDISLEQDEKLKELYDKRREQLFMHETYWKRLENYFTKAKLPLFRSQFVTFIDLSKQWLILLLWDNDHQAFYLIGSDLISSGDIDREGTVKNGEDHYLKTPTGVFTIQSGWRSDGKRLSDGVTFPYGQKNRFVFYFGKQKSTRYDALDENGEKLKDPSSWEIIDDELAFAVHAHQSSTYFGRPFSHGCVRMSNELNIFLDNNLVLHKKVLDDKEWISKSANPPSDPKYYDLAGEFLVIEDSI